MQKLPPRSTKAASNCNNNNDQTKNVNLSMCDKLYKTDLVQNFFIAEDFNNNKSCKS